MNWKLLWKSTLASALLFPIIICMLFPNQTIQASSLEQIRDKEFLPVLSTNARIRADEDQVYLPIVLKQLPAAPEATSTPTAPSPTPTNTPTPTETTSPVLPTAGKWSGMTDQSESVDFTVTSGGTSIIEFSFKYRLTCEGGSVTMSRTITGNWKITDNNFTISLYSGALYEGTFDSNTNAQGTWSDTFHDPVLGDCSGSGVWTAEWESTG
jgi:hypothetical protein